MCFHVHYKCAFKIALLITHLQLFSGEGWGEVASSGPVVKWSSGKVVHWSSGKVVKWSSGPVVKW